MNEQWIKKLLDTYRHWDFSVFEGPTCLSKSVTQYYITRNGRVFGIFVLEDLKVFELLMSNGWCWERGIALKA